MVCGSGGSKSRLAKSDHCWKLQLRCQIDSGPCGAKHMPKSKCTKHTRVGLPLQVEMPKHCKRMWHKAHLQIKMRKTHQGRTAVGSCDVRKVHAVVVRSTCPSQNAKNTPRQDHLCKLRCLKSTRPCGAKPMSKSKCPKHYYIRRPLWEAEMTNGN